MSNKEKALDHVAIIMDGNGRWAQLQGKERTYGHTMGAESVRSTIKSAAEKGISYLTLYVFSTENWGRPQQEVDMLMELLCQSVVDEVDELREQGAKVIIIGDRERMPDKVKQHLEIIEAETAHGETITVILALNYSSRSEIARAAKIISIQSITGELNPEDINEETVSNSLYTTGYPDPDLIIRTGGEYRLSNFLLWQGAYAELYFTDTYWPDFGKAEFDKAIDEFFRRERRFGKVTN